MRTPQEIDLRLFVETIRDQSVSVYASATTLRALSARLTESLEGLPDLTSAKSAPRLLLQVLPAHPNSHPPRTTISFWLETEDRGALVSAVRSKRQRVILAELIAALAARAWSVSEAVAVKDRTEQLAKERIDRWVYEAQKGGRTLGYKGKKDGDTVGLLKSPGPQPWETFTTPTSMREVEPNVSLILGGLEGVDAPKWEPAATPGGAVQEADE